MLALHRDVQDTLLKEIHDAIGDRDPTYEDFPSLVYPLCVMFETLRLFPTVVQVPKAALYGEQLLLGKHYIPKDTTVMYDVVNVHRNTKYWDNVDAFDPSRFDGRKGGTRMTTVDTGDYAPGGSYDKIRLPQKGAFVPFSEGSRSCLGASLFLDLSDCRTKVCPS
jgi:cytochrome P450